jgi:23S rRNA (uracil1939-C5)-methyltransferase
MEIFAVGADGDGIARLPDGTTRFLPFTLPGETVADGAVVTLSPDRVAPPCPHFGTCGGCALQHWAPTPYLEWKRGLLTAALARAGFPDAPVAATIPTPPHSRRRMDLAIRRQGPALLLGFHQRKGAIVDLDACPVLHPRLAALIPALRQLLRRLRALKREGSAVVNLLDNGPDILLRLDAVPDLSDRSMLAGFAEAEGAPRISVALGNAAPEPAAQRLTPVATLGGVPVTPAPGAFLQATASAEAAITDAVIAGLPPKRTARWQAAELYAGSGTLTFALARHMRVAAFEGDAAAHAALTAAANAAGLRGPVETARRDLTRQPLMAKELASYKVVVLDPPFDGAAVQIAQIALARPPRVIYVSCNPAALARDAAALHKAGYRILAATPIDQFLWSARLESVVVFALGK